MDWVIGGQDQVGRGWTMLMESLAAGRGISLPAASAGAAKLAARTSGAYVRVREQFGIEIGKFEGVQEVLGRIGGLTYLLDSGRLLATSAIDQGHKPSVISAIVKQQCTDLARTIVNDAMDLHGGKAICMGPGNYLARIYQQLPVGITVEGSNILTRSLIIYGQGVMRCHPFLLREIDAVQMQDKADALDQFDKVLTQHVEHIVASKLRCFCYGLSRGRLARGAGKGIVRKYTRTIEHFSAALAYLSDVTLFMLGGELKRKEMLSGRFADVLGNLYLACAALRRFRDNGEPENEEPLLEWACQYALYQAQQALDGILRNYPSRMMGKALRVAVFPAGRYVSMPRDQVTVAVAEILQVPGATRDRLTQDIYIPEQPEEILCQLEMALGLVIKTTELRKQLRKNGSHPGPGEDYMHWLDRIEQLGEISLEQRNLLKDTREMVEKVISVDSFGPDTS
jgi:acyl-CoA dehydrogenase